MVGKRDSLALPCVWAAIFLAAGGTGTAPGAVLRVPGEYATIKEAVDAAVDGDEIVVDPGTYIGNMAVSEKRVHLRSLYPRNLNCVRATILQPRQNQTANMISLGATASSISGFTLTGAIHAVAGGSGALIQFNHITGNYDGALAACNGVIQHNRITGNISFYYWNTAAAGLEQCSGIIQNNLISDNVQDVNWGGPVYAAGGGLRNCSGFIQFNRIVHNAAKAKNTYNREVGAKGGGMYLCTGTIRNNILAFNRTRTEYYEYALPGPIIWDLPNGMEECSGTIYNNTIVDSLTHCTGELRDNLIWPVDAPNTLGVNNSLALFVARTSLRVRADSYLFSNDPLFINPYAGDFRLSPDSPAIDAGTVGYVDASRPPGLGSEQADVGAYGGPSNYGWNAVVHEDYLDFLLNNPPHSPRKIPAMDMNGDGVIDISDLFRYWQRPVALEGESTEDGVFLPTRFSSPD